MTAPDPHIVPITFDVPESIPLSRIKAFLREFGIPTEGLTEFRVGMDGIYIEVRAVNERGRSYLVPDGDQVAVHRISIPLDRTA